MGIQLIRSAERHHTKQGWLDSYFSFSFAHYHDSHNTSFGALRVFNDDIFAPAAGFGMHPHADFEIMTYVISGELEHTDTMGNKGVIRAGEVQRMSAGSGLEHAEINPSRETPVRLLQIWFFPERRGLTPSYEQRSFTREQQRGRLLPVVSGRGAEGALQIHQDVTVCLSTLEAGSRIVHAQEPGRRIYLFVIDGEVELGSGERLGKGDTARMTGLDRLELAAVQNAELMLMDLA